MTTLREAAQAVVDAYETGTMRTIAGLEPLEIAGLRAALAQPDEQAQEIERLRAFARDVMQAWPDGDLDGADLQDAAVKHGLLTPEQRFEPCGDDGACWCASMVDHADWVDGVVCYRRAAWLKATP